VRDDVKCQSGIRTGGGVATPSPVPKNF